MPNWKKVIVSGSDASLSSLTTSGNISGSSASTGSFGQVFLGGNEINATGFSTDGGWGPALKFSTANRFLYVNYNSTYSQDAGLSVYHSNQAVNKPGIHVYNADGDAPAIVTDGNNASISGSATSTGSFGSLVVDDAVQGDLQINGNAYIKGGGLDLDSNQLITGQKTNNGTAFTFLKMYDGGDASVQLGSKHSLGYISFQAGNGAFTERMRIKNDGDIAIFNSHLSGSATSTGSFGDGHITGKLGIGTTDVGGGLVGGAKLDIYESGTNSDGRIKSRANDVVSSIGSARGSNRFFSISAGLELMTNSNHPILFSTNVTAGSATPQMMLNTSGQLGIGTTSPEEKLSIGNGSIQLENQQNITWSDIGDGNTGRVRIYGSEDSDYIRMNVDNSNNHSLALTTTGVGIGTLTPSVKLEVVGDISGSVIRASGDVIAFNSSDERYKDNLQPISEPLWKVNQIGGYTFDWNDKQDTYEGHDVGVIAQEIHKVLPEVVGEKNDGYLGVKYEKIVPLLIESIKELNKKIEDIEKNCDCLNK